MTFSCRIWISNFGTSKFYLGRWTIFLKLAKRCCKNWDIKTKFKNSLLFKNSKKNAKSWYFIIPKLTSRKYSKQRSQINLKVKFTISTTGLPRRDIYYHQRLTVLRLNFLENSFLKKNYTIRWRKRKTYRVETKKIQSDYHKNYNKAVEKEMKGKFYIAIRVGKWNKITSTKKQK